MRGIHIYIKRTKKKGYIAECETYPELSCIGKTKDAVRNEIIPLILKEESKRNEGINHNASSSVKKQSFGFC